MRGTLFSIISALLMVFTTAASAFTYQPMLDEDLRDQAPIILRGQVVSDASQSGRSRSYQIAVISVYKGMVPANEITVAVPGSVSANAHRIPGLPRFEVGEEVVLFLVNRPSGAYRLIHLSLGAFHARRDVSNNPVFVRKLASAVPVPTDIPERGAVNEVPRKAAGFLKWLGDSEAGYGSAYSALPSTLSDTSGSTEKAAFTLLGTQASRWREFDSGVPVSFRSHVAGQDQVAGGGVQEFQNALAAWTNDEGSQVMYSYGGTTNAIGGLDSSDGINTILFDDPNDEVDGTFSCSEGGVLAMGGFVTSGKTHSFQGKTYREIVEGDIVTNDGAGCFFKGQGNSNGEEIFGHELGHTLGFGHSCEHQPLLDQLDCLVASLLAQNALMRSTPHADGRGAMLTEDDENVVRFVYPAQSSVPNPDPDPDPDPQPSNPQPAPNNNGGGGGSSSGGGGGCSMAATGNPATGILLPILLVFSALILLLRSDWLRAVKCR